MMKVVWYDTSTGFTFFGSKFIPTILLICNMIQALSTLSTLCDMGFILYHFIPVAIVT